MLGGDWGVDTSLIKLIVVGHVDIACTGLKALYFCILGFESCCQAVDMVSGLGELLGGDSGLPFDGGGKAKGHCVGDLAEFLLTEVDESLGGTGGERGV